MVNRKSGERKQQILQALALMLEQPRREKITTAALAERLSVSEAALYRHFASKAQMYEGLIGFIESSVFSVINQIRERQELGMQQVHDIVIMLLNFVKRNPGMARVMLGDIFINENERLQARMNQFFNRIELSIRQSLHLAATQGHLEDSQVTTYGNLIISFLMGKIFGFVRSDFKLDPIENIAEQIKMLF